MGDVLGVRHRVLDHGFICLTDVMGTDQSVEEAARVSYGEGTRATSDTRTLIRYLMRHKHMTPFEMAELKFLIRVPMDCWRQWVRHRTASINEYSTRYSVAIDAQQTTGPDEWRLQNAENKQGSSGFLVDTEGGKDIASHLSACESIFHAEAKRLYSERLALGIAREQARKDLPLCTYTEAYWKIDLRNLLNFLSLRMDSHAQDEIRAYATVIGEQIVKPLFPIVWDAFNDYVLGAISLSALDRKALMEIVKGKSVSELGSVFGNKRELAECVAKLTSLGLVS